MLQTPTPTRYQLIGHEFEDEAIYCRIKVSKLNKEIVRSAADIYYDDDWLSGFNVKDIRIISTLVAQEDLSKTKFALDKQRSSYFFWYVLRKWGALFSANVKQFLK